MIFQQFNLVGRLDVLTNVLMGRLSDIPSWRSLAQLWPEEDLAVAMSALEQFDMASLAAQRADQLSGGQQQRVAIARALVQEPDIILADEPIASLDPRNTRIVMDALLRINKHFGITVICNLHSLDLARSYCDRLIGMAAGRIVFDGAPATLTEHIARELYDLEANEVMGTAPAGCPPVQRFRLSAPLPRPEHRRRQRVLAKPQAIDFNTGKEDVMINRRTMIAGTASLALSATAALRAGLEDEISRDHLRGGAGGERLGRHRALHARSWTICRRNSASRSTLRIANDYAAVIEGQRAGNIQIAYYGPASFSRARLTGVKTDAFVIDVNADGSKGYYSVFYVLAKSPYQKLEDLKGKNLGLVDPNSTSGNNMPRFKMNQMGVDPDSFFSQVVFTGSHENAVLALAQGTVDVAANWWNADDDSNLTRMLAKNMVKSSDGTPLKKEDFRIIVKSDLIINSPYAYLSDLPDDMKAAIKQAFLDAPEKDKDAFKKLSDGKNLPWQTITNDDYDKTIELIKFVDNLRKKAS